MKLRDLHANARLQEVYTLWHKCAEAYEDPDQFRTYLNACIQAIRNVTFVLQKQKSEIDEFDEWYSVWQEALKNDHIMKWCVQARNTIVKIGDLEKHSVAIVSHVSSYLDSPKHTFGVSPFASTIEIAHHITIDLLPEELRSLGFLRIERRWISVDFPETELLEVLAYAFAVLVQLLMDIETRKGPHLGVLKKDLEGEPVKSAGKIQIEKSKLPFCMAEFEEYRIEWLKLPNLEAIKAIPVPDKVRVVPKENIIKRYGELPTLSGTESEGLSPLKKLATLFLRQAKAALKKDKHLFSVAFLMTDDHRVTITRIEYTNYEDKYLVWESVAKEIEHIGATSIITIGETWSAPFDPENPEMRPHESPKRSEGIFVAALSKDGESFTISLPFLRRRRKIYYGEEIISEDCCSNHLKPIQRIWASQ